MATRPRSKHTPRGHRSDASSRGAALLADAVAHHQGGRLDSARLAYSRILEADPANFDALHLLGVLSAQIGQPELAVRMIRLALELRPGAAEALNNLASALAAAGDEDGAEAALRAALARSPRYVDALANLGGLLLRRERHAEAFEALSAALRIAPNHAGICNDLGSASRRLGQVREAEQLYRNALAKAPAHLQASLNLASLLLERDALDEAQALLERATVRSPSCTAAYRLLGDVEARRGQVGPAHARYEQALALDPDDAATCSRLGMLAVSTGDSTRALVYLQRAAEVAPRDPDVLANLALGAVGADRIDEGVNAARTALEIDPQHVNALVNLSALERVRGRFDETERLARTALAITPGRRAARLNLSTALMEMGRHEDADLVLRAMIAADPADPEAHWNLAIGALARGSLAAGWREFAWRWRLPHAEEPSPVAAPEWSGESLSGRRILVWPEQGLGDQITFASMLPDLLERRGQITLRCDARLAPLLARSFPEITLVCAGREIENHTTHFDYQIPLGSLPEQVRPSLKDFPQRQRLFVADEAKRRQWRDWLDSLAGGWRVGVSWRSHDLRGERRLACASLAQWEPLLKLAGAQFVCLQYDECQAEIEALERRCDIRLHRPPALDQWHDLDSVAALASELDLIVSAPTTVSLLAGAMGTPTWQLGSGIDWHGLNQPYSPWLPSVRRFYKPWDRTWDAELAHAADELARLLGR